MKQLQQYTYTIPANGSVQIPAANDNFIITAATGPVTVRGDTFGSFVGMVAGQGLKDVPFQRLELFDISGAPNTVTVLISPAEFVNQVFSGAVSVVGPVALDAATLDGLRTPLAPTGNYQAIGAMTGNTNDMLFAAAANVNGAVLLSACMSDSNGVAPVYSAYLAKAGAPANNLDGAVLLAARLVGYGASNWLVSGELAGPQFIPAGLGLYFVAGSGGFASSGHRAARWRLL